MKIEMRKIEFHQTVSIQMYLEAISFYESAKVIKDSIGDSSMYYEKYPYYVMLSFSIELLLKCIHVTSVIEIDDSREETLSSKINHINGHRLDEIFDRHSDKMKRFLSNAYEIKFNRSLRDDLICNGNVFTKFRYTYPRDGNGSSEKSLYPDILEDTALFMVEEIKALYDKQSGR
ncbi:hypothetical protein QEH52_05080 [Coraliomargarita sp. SDUM461003]|uniref:HEPN domain-containing protein n=1 Tax=Thalassobacterium maritimum TaxID=3041265 RepID=A0ABU1AUS5_9BACT|nr:hypothetical protein [Coraliomargarita sp. SDUM461003]MDQ8206870.1 hypothetical protein [Coraliomargarita sp. SDUM461003]